MLRRSYSAIVESAFFYSAKEGARTTSARHGWWPMGCLTLAALAWSPELSAQTAPPSTDPEETVAGAADGESVVAQAKAAYERAIEAYGQRRYKDAIDLFLRADQLSPNPAFSFNIGIAYEDMGDPALALRYHRAYVRQAPQAADRDEVERRIERLEAKLQEKGVQQVTVLSEPPGATVVVDGQPVGVSPWTGELAPGHHQVALQLRGYKDDVRDFDLPPSRSIDVPVTLSPDVRNRTHALTGKSNPNSPGSPGPWFTQISRLSWIVTGAGVASLGVAAGFELARSSAEDSAAAEPIQIRAEPLLEKAQSRETTA
ncbi:MAG: hypothetical protein RJA70_4288, partial [Pseudomonadota bacterium]